MPCLCLVLVEAKETVRSPGTGVTDGVTLSCEQPHGAGTTPGSSTRAAG